MTRFILPIILVGISVTLFFTFGSPIYSDISDARAQVASYDLALSNSKALEDARDKLTQKYNSISKDNLDRIQKLLPENVDNIRLILEIEKIALPYSMVLRDVKYSPTVSKTAAAAAAIQQDPAALNSPKDYGVWDLEFSTSGSYNDFLNFLKDLESNLRIVDISSIDFSSDNPAVSGAVASASPTYKYTFKIKTYWLKN